MLLFYYYYYSAAAIGENRAMMINYASSTCITSLKELSEVYECRGLHFPGTWDQWDTFSF